MSRALLAEGADPDRRDETGNTALMLAAREGHPSVVRLLKRQGARLRRKNDAGQTARDVAREAGHLGIVRILSETAGETTSER